MKHKSVIILISMAISLSVSCSPSAIAPTSKIDVPATAAPKPAPTETATVTRTVPTAPVPRTLALTMPPTPTLGGQGNMNGTPAPTPLNSEAEQIVLQAKQGLAKQLTISIDQISLVEVQEVTWPDSSLGCPQPGMMYTQALVDGYLIRLRAGERIYEYHSGGNRPPFLCQTK